MRAIIAIPLALLFVVNCGGRSRVVTDLVLESVETRKTAEANLCDLNRRTASYAVATVDIGDGNIINGDINTRAQVAYEEIWTAFAAPGAEKIVVMTEEPGMCSKQLYPNYWYYSYYENCETELVYELGDVYGLGRGPSRSIAEELAMDNCESAVDGLRSNYPNLDRARFDRRLDCRMKVQLCDR